MLTSCVCIALSAKNAKRINSTLAICLMKSRLSHPLSDKYSPLVLLLRLMSPGSDAAGVLSGQVRSE